MKKILIAMSLTLIFASCSSEIDTFDYDPKYLIEIDFKTGLLKEGGKVLQAASPELSDICLKALRNETLPEGYKAEITCQGSGGNNVLFYYIKLISSNGSNYYLVSSNGSVTMVHIVTHYEQNNCLKRWIKN